MEILSDATFKGNVSINGSFHVNPFNDNKEIGLQITKGDGSAPYIKFKGTEFFEGQTHFSSGFSVGPGQSVILPRLICIGHFDCINSLTFPSASGTLALTSDITSEIQCALPCLSGFLKYKKVPIDFDVAADCTKFATSDGTGIPLDNVISLNLFKQEVISIGNGRWPAIKQVPADVWAQYCGGSFIVEKSSAFAISSTDGYEIRASYYE